jgi:hypothetical protein
MGEFLSLGHENSGIRTLNAFRKSIALLACLYFARQGWEVPAFHSNLGLIDHGWAEATLPYLWQPLFRPDQSELMMQFILFGASLLCVPLALGLYPRLCTAILYLILSCSYRWNFLVATVDDEMMHLSLFWLLILLNHPEGPGRRLFALNFSLIYLVAGLSKWTSPLWRSGLALAVVAQLPGSRLPGGMAGLDPHPMTWLALLVEPLFGLLPWLPRGRARRGLLVLWISFHLLLVLTFDVAVANLCCLAAGLVILQPAGQSVWKHSDRLAGLVVALLFVSQVGSLLQPSWRSGAAVAGEAGAGLQYASNAGLWCLGLAQQYRLLDWIDERNYQAWLSSGQEQIYPALGHLRRGLALSYLTPAPWLRPPPDQQALLRQSSYQRWQRWSGAPIQIHCRRIRACAAL